MPWTDLTPMDQRLELVTLARSGEFTVTELASRFGVTKKKTREGGIPGVVFVLPPGQALIG